MTDREKSNLIGYLVDNGYTSEETADNTLCYRTYNDYHGIDSFRELIEAIYEHFASKTGVLSPERVEDGIFCCVPNTFEVRDQHYSQKSVSCFEKWHSGVPLGKSFEDIKCNMKYKKQYISGECTYEGPEVMSKEIKKESRLHEQ